MNIEKKHIIAVGIGLFTIAGALVYLQVKKIMQNTFSYAGTKVKKLSSSLIDLDLFFNYTNKSDIRFTIRKQTYDVFVNGTYITTLSNAMDNVVRANTTSKVGVNVAFNPIEVAKKIGVTNILSGTENMKIKIVMKFSVKIGFITFNIPYTYEDTLKNMTSGV